MIDTSANLSDTDTEMQAQNKVTVEHLTMVEEDKEVDELKEDSELDQDEVESSNGESEGNGDDRDEEGSGEEGESTQDDTDDSQIQLDDMMIVHDPSSFYLIVCLFYQVDSGWHYNIYVRVHSSTGLSCMYLWHRQCIS